jgi:hypothetical protein
MAEPSGTRQRFIAAGTRRSVDFVLKGAKCFDPKNSHKRCSKELSILKTDITSRFPKEHMAWNNASIAAANFLQPRQI